MSSSVSVARRSCELLLGLLVLHGLANVEMISAQFGDDETFWADTDDFDRIHDKYHGVNEDNCAFKHVGDLKVSGLQCCKIAKFDPFLSLRPHALHPCAIQGKEGIKFCSAA